MNLSYLKEYRAWTFHLSDTEIIHNINDAKNFINQRGFIFLWPISGINMPSLWTAVAGDRPVAEAHDDPGHVTWQWKDVALEKKFWYYAKVLCRKATFISFDTLPYFYALSKNFGSPEEDHLIAYSQGYMSQAAKDVYTALLDKGSLNTLDLRKEARLLNAKGSVFAKALEDLQKDLKILPVGISEAGGWRYSYRYEITSRYYPELVENARSINESTARCYLAKTYLSSIGACKERDIQRIFGWSRELVNRTIERMKEERQILLSEIPQSTEEYFTSPNYIKFLRAFHGQH